MNIDEVCENLGVTIEQMLEITTFFLSNGFLSDEGKAFDENVFFEKQKNDYEDYE